LQQVNNIKYEIKKDIIGQKIIFKVGKVYIDDVFIHKHIGNFYNSDDWKIITKDFKKKINEITKDIITK